MFCRQRVNIRASLCLLQWVLAADRKVLFKCPRRPFQRSRSQFNRIF